MECAPPAWLRPVRSALLMESAVHQVFQRGADAPALVTVCAMKTTNMFSLESTQNVVPPAPDQSSRRPTPRTGLRPFPCGPRNRGQIRNPVPADNTARHHAGSRSRYGSRHIGDGLRTEIALAVQGAAVGGSSRRSGRSRRWWIPCRRRRIPIFAGRADRPSWRRCRSYGRSGRARPTRVFFVGSVT